MRSAHESPNSQRRGPVGSGLKPAGRRTGVLSGPARTALWATEDIIGVVAHDLRAPLSAILTWLRTLHGNLGNERVVLQATHGIEHAARAQVRLIEDLLDWSRVLSGTLEPRRDRVDLSRVIADACELHAPNARSKGVQLVLNVGSGGRAVWGDEERLLHVVSNLLENAIKFTPSGGRVSVELRNERESAVLTVADTGTGMDKQELARVFNRFRRVASTKRSRASGLGLGLTIARHVVELHGGTIHADSGGPDRGATFTVRLPYE